MGDNEGADVSAFKDLLLAVRDLSWKVDSGFRMLGDRIAALESRVPSEDAGLFRRPWMGHDAFVSPYRSRLGEDSELDSIAKRLTKSMRLMLAKFEGPVIVRLSPSDFAQELIDSEEFVALLISQVGSESDLIPIKDLCKRKIKDSISNRKKSLKKKVGNEAWSKTESIMDEKSALMEKQALRQHLIELQYDQIQNELNATSELQDDDDDDLDNGSEK